MFWSSKAPSILARRDMHAPLISVAAAAYKYYWA